MTIERPTDPSADWERRNGELWASLDALPEEEFRSRMDAFVGELPAGHPVAAFERAPRRSTPPVTRTGRSRCTRRR